MSDLASPLLVTMGDEAHAYICLCALMTRLYPNFLLDGEAMTLKFSHLTESLQVYDPDFYNYLKSQQADDLLFCYRWLLLEMKREFAFDDALRMLEVLWASLPQKSPAIELPLKEKDFNGALEITVDPPPLSPLVKAPRENAYTKVCAIRRQSSSFSLANVKAPKLATTKQTNHSLDENAARKALNNSSLKHAKEFQSLDDAALRTQKISNETQESINDENNSESLPTQTKDCKNASRMKSVPEHGKVLEVLDATNSSTPLPNTENLTNGTIQCDMKETPLGNQIRLLRDKISVHNKFFSLDTLDDSNETDIANKPKVKMIKNLNEFLNFATGNKVAIVKQDKLQRTHSAIERKECPKITLTKTSYDESDITSLALKTQMNKISKLSFDTNDGSSPDDSQEYYPMTTSMTRELRLEVEHLDRQVFGLSYVNRCSMICDSPSDSTSTEDKPEYYTEAKENCVATDAVEIQTEVTETVDIFKRSPLLDTIKSNARSAEDIYLWENPLHRNTPTTRTTASCPQTPDEQADLDFDGDTGEIFEEHSGKKSVTPIRLLRKNHSLEPPDTSKRPSSTIPSSESDSSDKDLVESINTTTVKSNPLQEGPNPKSHKFFSNMSHELENAKRNCESLLNVKQSNLQSVASTINNFQKKYEVFKPPAQKNPSVAAVGSDHSVKTSIGSLPSPPVFGGGNPFLMYLCLTVLLQHRDYIMRNRMDYNELAMHFDKMVRKHNVNRVLNQARQMYAIYLKQQAHKTGDVTT